MPPMAPEAGAPKKPAVEDAIMRHTHPPKMPPMAGSPPPAAGPAAHNSYEDPAVLALPSPDSAAHIDKFQERLRRVAAI